MSGGAGATRLAALALVANALIWGTSWWPMRWLQERGLHPLWSTALTFSVASIVIVAARPRAVGQVLTTPSLWLLVAAAGVTNACFNWAVVIGDVVRVVLLFYLMPIWAVLLARVVLGEAVTRAALLRVALALAGAVIVLWPDGGNAGPGGTGLAALPLPRTLAEWLGIVGGFSFAFNNVMLRREAGRPEGARALAMFLGGAVVALALALGPAASTAGLPPAVAPGWVSALALLSLVFLAGNLALQYGAARLPAQRTAVVMLTEVVFAAGSAALLGAGVIGPRVLAGGALIVASAALAAVGPRTPRRTMGAPVPDPAATPVPEGAAADPTPHGRHR